MGNTSAVEQPKFTQAWSVIEPSLVVQTAQDHKHAVALLDRLLDLVGDDERHPLFSLLEVLGMLIENYEHEHVDMRGSTPVEVLKFLMEEHDLTQSGLPEVGSQGVVSEILHGRRQLNTQQIKALSRRFHVSPEAFF